MSLLQSGSLLKWEPAKLKSIFIDDPTNYITSGSLTYYDNISEFSSNTSFDFSSLGLKNIKSISIILKSITVTTQATNLSFWGNRLRFHFNYTHWIPLLAETDNTTKTKYGSERQVDSDSFIACVTQWSDLFEISYIISEDKSKYTAYLNGLEIGSNTSLPSNLTTVSISREVSNNRFQLALYGIRFKYQG